MADRFRIRPARPDDLPRLLELERACYSDPWSARGLEEALAPPAGFGLVAEGARGVVGYLIARDVGGSGEILNLAVAPGARRRGLAQDLVAGALEVMASQGATEVFLEVRESNAAARALYDRAGFRVTGMRRGYYRSPTEDALVMRLELPVSA